LQLSQDLDLEETTPTISFHALVNINTPKSLNIQGYIKNKKVMVLIYSSSTHNFINYKLAKYVNCFVFPTQGFQLLIADEGTIIFFGKCHSINLNIGESILNSPMITIQIGGANVLLGVEWFQSLGTIAINFQDIFMRFSLEGKEIDLRGIQKRLLQ
jgi:hypothetical protein